MGRVAGSAIHDDERFAQHWSSRDYGVDLCFQSPSYKSMKLVGTRITVTFDIGQHRQGALDTFDVREPIGFAIAGSDKQFVWAKAKIVGRDQVEVWNNDVKQPVAVRYAWADNPVCNLQNQAGLPANSFRSDDWPGVTIDVHK